MNTFIKHIVAGVNCANLQRCIICGEIMVDLDNPEPPNQAWPEGPLYTQQQGSATFYTQTLPAGAQAEDCE